MKPHNAYDIIKYAIEFDKGNTIMKNYRDPQSQMCCIGGFLSKVYEDARLVNLTIGEPKPSNLTQIHDEVMKKLECMAYAHRRDARIGGHPIPFCVVRPQPYRRFTPCRSYELLVSSPL